MTAHAFEPLPSLCDDLASSSANYHVHAMAVAEQAGMARFHIYSFDVASSLAMVEMARAAWEGGHATLRKQGGSRAALRALLAAQGYRLLQLDTTIGEPMPLQNDVGSDNLVAVHSERDWGLPQT
jgi:hypothetical protein